MKKIVILLCCIFISHIGMSQRRITVSGLSSFSSNPNSQGPKSLQPRVNASSTGNVGTMYSQSAKYKYENAYIEGSQYLFEQWKNDCLIMVGNRKYVIPNINFNMDKQAFMSKFADSMLVYDFKVLDKVLVNGKMFKSVYNASEGQNKIYEILYSSNDFSIFKENFIEIKEASPNPMLNRPNRKIKQKSKYFVYTKGKFDRLKLKKDDLLSLLSEDEVKRIEAYAQSNKLSYKKEKDVDRMLTYINKS